MQRNLLLLLFFLLPAAFQARADFTGPPMEAVVAVWALGLVGGFFACALVAFLVKQIVEAFTRKKRRHIWFQTSCMYLFLALFLYLEDSEHLLDQFDEANYSNWYWTCFFLSLTSGWIIGNRLTPKQKDQTGE